MSFSMHVFGFVPPDETWAKHKAVWDACKALGVDIPEKVERFFDEGDPSDHGKEVPLTVVEWSNPRSLSQGFDLQVADIPKNVKVIRFHCSH